MSILRVGVVGAGRMGRIRAISAKGHNSCTVTRIADSVADRASALASEVGAHWTTDWASLLAADDVDAVVVATTHRYLSPISAAVLHAGKHLFCEKPMARQVGEAADMINSLRNREYGASGVPRAIVGYTLRHHPAMQKAWQIVMSGEIGRVLYVRGRYGHGGRAGYEEEWRTSPEESGGGELMDQGVHLIDLSRCFLGDFTKTIGSAKCFHWAKGRSEVEDNAFMILETSQEKVAFLHASWTQWKNIFSFEVFGELGCVIVEGLGGSYGTETLRLVKRRLLGGPPEIVEHEFPSHRRNGLDEVWALEWEAFVRAVAGGADQNGTHDLPAASLQDGHAVLQTVAGLYEFFASENSLTSVM
jgi:predicted dehydrogenase